MNDLDHMMLVFQAELQSHLHYDAATWVNGSSRYNTRASAYKHNIHKTMVTKAVFRVTGIMLD